MRLIDADKLSPDRLTDKGLAISQTQIADAKTISAIVIPDDITRGEIIEAIFPDIPKQVYWSIQTIMEAETNSDWWNARYRIEAKIDENSN